MEITFVVPELNLNGGLRVISIYANLLAKKGHKVTVVSPNKKIPTLRQKIKSVINWKGYQFKSSFNRSYFENTNYDLNILEQYRPVTCSDVPDADIVIATWWETAHWVNKFSKEKGKKVYFMQDYGDVPGQPLDKVQETWMLPFHIITISKWLMNLVKSHRQHDENLTLVVNGIELSVFNTQKRDKQKIPTVGFLYTDVPQKGIDFMFSSFLKAKETLPELRLIMFGSKDLPAKLQTSTDVTYYQKLSDEDIVKVYGSCDAWLFGSEREGFGLPILEAMACRTPVIATNAGAAADLVSSKSGALLTSRSIDEMAVEILAIVSLDNSAWKKLSDGAHQIAETNTWEIASQKFENVLLKL